MGDSIETVSDNANSAPETREAEENQEQARADDLDPNENEDTEAETTENDSEVENDEEDEVNSEGEENTDKKPRRSGFKKRIGKLTRRAQEAQKEAEYWRRVALEKADRTKEGGESQKEEPEKTALAEKPNVDDYEYQEDYIEALTDWKLEQKLSKQEEKRAQTEAQKSQGQALQEFQARVGEFAQKTPDFEEVMEEIDDVDAPDYVRQTLMDSEVGPEILYSLGRNPEEARRIVRLDPLRAIREIGRLEQKILFEKEKESTPPAKKNTKASKAPPPISTVRGGAKVAKDINDPSLTQQEYEALRRKQMADRAI